MIDKKTAMLNPPNEIHLSVKIPENIDTYRKLQKYLWKNFHIDVDLSEEWFSYLFYNPDLRSLMGFVYEFGTGYADLVLWPQYYIDKDPSTSWSKKWRQLVKQSEIVELG